MTLYLATDSGPVVVTERDDRWRAHRPLDVPLASSIAADPDRPEQVFCSTVRSGVWRSDDAGRNWQRVFEDLPGDRITAVAVSGVERAAGRGVVYVGTEPSTVVRSEDGGETWRECKGLTDLPSSSEWSFPPRPETHHVRWIEPDPHESGRLHVAIEAGALVRSPDGGTTWEDRVEGAPWDTHQLVTHRGAPGRLWSAAGDGFFESGDGGQTWHTAERGLRHRYCWSVAVDPSDPETVVLSSAASARRAHDSDRAEAHLYRRTADTSWQEVTEGLPDPEGLRTYALAADPMASGVFYAASDGVLYRSADSGTTWHELSVDWPSEAAGARIHVMAAVVVG